MTFSPTEAHAEWRGENWHAKLLLCYARNFPAHRGKTRIFQALVRMLFRKGMPLKSENGARLVVDALDYIGNQICFSGAFEPMSLTLARQIMDDGGVFLDVGANIGVYSCCIAALPGVECIAIDASPTAFVKLQENVERNRNARITAVNVALGIQRSLVTLISPRHGNLGTGRVSRNLAMDAHHRCLVPCMPLQELLTLLQVGQIKLLKIDVEGFELQVFRGLDFNSTNAPINIIAEHRRDLETDSSEHDTCFRFLLDHGYTPFTVNGDQITAGHEPPEFNVWWRRNS